uniref:Uncharacterized protein n=1 Tax=Panagrolaimus superbus TaxID=310955 RepID=A0A914Z5V1_9BILA
MDGKLEFKFCSEGCRDQTVSVCYDAQNIDSSLQTGCPSNQCMFKAGVSKSQGSYFLWFFDRIFPKGFTSDICETAL